MQVAGTSAKQYVFLLLVNFVYRVWVCRTFCCSKYISFPVSKEKEKSELIYFCNSKKLLGNTTRAMAVWEIQNLASTCLG